MDNCFPHTCGLVEKRKLEKFYLTKQGIYYYNNVDLCREVEAMKRTHQPNNRKKSKRLGFFARKKTNVLNRRRRKGRKSLCK